ncbi:MAG: hypothetical protein ACYDDU_21410 [Dermatophilaceae bacterium]
MTSWRHTASDLAQHDLDELLDACIGFAQQQLADHGEFFPYAAAIRANGQVEMIASRPDLTNNRPKSAAVIASCEVTLADMREALRAAAVVADVRTTDGDCIQVNLEHAEGPALTVLLAYARRRFRGTVDYGQLTATTATPRIWSS